MLPAFNIIDVEFRGPNPYQQELMRKRIAKQHTQIKKLMNLVFFPLLNHKRQNW